MTRSDGELRTWKDKGKKWQPGLNAGLWRGLRA
jgi:hypothetical protein